MDAPREIVELVERFGRQLDAYRSGQYKEAQLRSEFIDPFFEALGWDVHNRKGYAEAYKDVIHEDAIKVGGATKAPDYCFRIGGARKFFVEAKKPSIDIRDAAHPAYQLRRYAWSAKLPLSILTDFEEFAAYDCTVKPADTDKASTARVLYLTYNEYSQRWDDIASIFSRDAVLKGSFDKYAESAKRKKGTAEVDSAFLKEIESWRESLARHIALRNPNLTQRELNFAVQRTIDRIIFLRICEDRGIEHYGQLMALLNGTEVYARLCRLFYEADRRYNSGLFYFQKEKDRADSPDELTPRLTIDDKPLKDIIRRLYYPESPYEFSVLPADILGQVYEQFLGKVIRLTAAHRAVVEDKPEVKKAGGIYYTPTYIVDYIVKNTVGKLLGETGSGCRGPGLGKGEPSHDAEDIPGTGSVAAGDGPRRVGLQAGREVPSAGEVRTDEPDSESSGVNSGEHSGGPRPAASGGLSSVSFHSERVPDGGGDSPSDRGEAGLSGEGSGEGGLDSVAGCWASAQRSHPVTGERGASGHHEKPGTTGPGPQSERLTHDPQPPTPDPGPPVPDPRSLTPGPQSRNPSTQALTPNDASKLRILDPACGSGSFLIGAYQYLLDWHLNWYTAHNPETWARKKNPPIRQSSTPAPDPQPPLPDPQPRPPDPQPLTPGPQSRTWRLTTSERKRILLNNIYGVDIDPQAVEVTKLSLLLKVLEGEKEETLEKQFKLFRERALPDLGRNIKCGNSLIGPDFYDNQQMTFLDEEERYRINAFDWNAEFPEIMKSGGFDAVIGNPPYVRQESLVQLKAYMRRTYKSYHGMADLYVYFIEKGLDLIRPGGLLGIIVSSSLLRATYATRLRRRVRESGAIVRIVDFGGLSVFENAKDVYVCIPVFAKAEQPAQVGVCRVPPMAGPQARDLLRYVSDHQYMIPTSRLSPAGWSLEDEPRAATFDKVTAVAVPLGTYVHGRIFRGILTGLNQAFEIDDATRAGIVAEAPHCRSLIRRLVGGQDIRRYFLRDSARHLIVIPCGWTARQMDAAPRCGSTISERYAWDWLRGEYGPIARHLEGFAEAAKRRQDRGHFWWELRPCDYYDALENPKLIYPDIAKGPRFFFDDAGTYISNTAYCLATDDLYLLGVLNSKLSWFAIGRISIPFGTRAGLFRYRLICQYMEQFPVRALDPSDPVDQGRHHRMVKPVEAMLELHKKLAGANTDHEKTVLQRQIDTTDRQIDQIVYEVYGLTDEEIKIVEEGGR